MQTRRTLLTAGMLACAGLLLGNAKDDLVDLNTATLDELMRLPGVTRVWAARIVKYRPYWRKDELLDRGIVPSAVYERIAEKIVAHRVKR